MTTVKYRITNQRQLRREFWQTFPELPHCQFEYGNYRSYPCDTRCTFVDWLDTLAQNADISPELAGRATL